MLDDTTTTAPTVAVPTTSAPDEASAARNELMRIACDIATGVASDPTASAIRMRGSWRDLNAKQNGSETYRRALSPGRAWRFASSEKLPYATFLAGDRKAVVYGDVFVGDLLADYDRAIAGGRSKGAAVFDGKIGIVVGVLPSGKADIEWCDTTKQKDGMYRVILPTGAHHNVADPSWR